MSVTIFPRKHLGQRQPAVLLLDIPRIEMIPETHILPENFDGATYAAVMSELEQFSLAIKAADSSLDRIRSLLKPHFMELSR